jgi:hypothetical protein
MDTFTNPKGLLDIATERNDGISSRSARLVSMVIHALLCFFFIILYWHMTLTGEDISQFAASANKSFLSIVLDTYNYLPRVGEIYQHLIIPHYEPIAQFDFWAVPRLFDVLFALIFIYVLAWFALLRRPKLDARTALAAGIIFSILILTPANMLFLSRFSCFHNYVLGYLITAAFCIPFARSFLRDTPDISKGASCVLFILGFLTGYSTEVSPAILFLLLLFAVIARYRQTKILNSWMIKGMSGLLMGIVLFYATGGLNSRVNGAYAHAYEYAFSRNFITEWRSLFGLLFSHLQFNSKKLWPWIFCYASIFVICFVRSRLARAGADRSKWLACRSLTSALLAFSLIYLGISSVIRVDDELFGRYMAGIYICIALAAAHFIDLFAFVDFKKRYIVWPLNALAVLLFHDYRLTINML